MPAPDHPGPAPLLYTPTKPGKNGAILVDAGGPLRAMRLDELSFQVIDRELVVLAKIDAPDVPTPRSVQMVEKRMRDELQRDVRFVVRANLISNVSAAGYIDRSVARALSGLVVDEDPEEDTMRRIGQVIRAYFGDLLGIRLNRLHMLSIASTRIVFADVVGIRTLQADEIRELRQAIRSTVAEPTLELAVRQGAGELHTDSGVIRSEFVPRRLLSPAEARTIDTIETFLTNTLSQEGYSVSGSAATILDGVYHAVAEVVGPIAIEPQRVTELERRLTSDLDERVELMVRCTLETVVSRSGHLHWDDVLRDLGHRTRTVYEEETRTLIEAWR